MKLKRLTVTLRVNNDTKLELWVWIKEYEPEKFLLIAKSVKDGLTYCSWPDAVRDYIDVTHLRNWILKDCEDLMDSNGLDLIFKFMNRYKYERPAKVKHVYQALI